MMEVFPSIKNEPERARFAVGLFLIFIGCLPSQDMKRRRFLSLLALAIGFRVPTEPSAPAQYPGSLLFHNLPRPATPLQHRRSFRLLSPEELSVLAAPLRIQLRH